MGRAAFLALAIALAACASKPPIVLGERMPAGCDMKSMSERCFGWIFDRVLMAGTFKPYYDRDIHDYVASIGTRIARANNDHHHWTFRVLDDDTPQAYAGFNSIIYITRGALAILRDEAELASVIAHEMGHTISGHHREAVNEITRDVTDSELQKWRDLRYARDDEIQADEQAVLLLARAGYDVQGVVRMLRALGGYVNDDDEDASDDRHPVFRERIARAAALAARHPDGERGIERYNARVAKLVIGDDPLSVAVVDTAVVFARAGIAFDLPADSKAAVLMGRMVMFVLPGEIVGTAQLLERGVAAEIKNTDDKTFTEIKVVNGTALSITIVRTEGTNPLDAIAKSVAAKSRAPHPDEVARLHPIQFDPTKPRPIWAR